MVPCKGSVESVILELTGGIRSGMTYIGAATISEMKEKAQFMKCLWRASVKVNLTE